MEKISPRCKAYLRSHMRDAWRWYSEARKECLKNKLCVVCGKEKKKRYADHIDPVGAFVPEDQPYLRRMFCDLSNLQVMCKECHDVKSASERKKRSKK